MAILAALFLVIGTSTGISEDRIVQADEVLSTINAGATANFDDCTIIGDLDLNELKIIGDVHFNHTTFQDSVNLSNTMFSDSAYFRNAIFGSLP